MGLFKKSCYTNSSPAAVQPNPSVFRIDESVNIGSLWVSRVHYPNATNYEGRKILVTDFNPKFRRTLDPHFSEGGGIIARFEPTAQGWLNALSFAKTKND